jgi:hypothetical protein
MSWWYHVTKYLWFYSPQLFKWAWNNGTIDAARSASCHDLLLEIDTGERLRTTLCDKGDI